MPPVDALFKTIPLITTPLALLAFLAAAAVVAHARAIGRAESLIRTAPETDRRALVAGALSILNLRVDKLTRDQRFDLALEELRGRRLRSWFAFSSCIFLGGIFGGLAVYSVKQQREDPQATLAALLSGPAKVSVLSDLRTRGIYDVSERDAIDFLVSRTALSHEEERSISEQELIKRASEKYDSVPSVTELRRRAEERAEPFRPLGRLVTVTVPGERDDQPRQFFSHVPKNSPFAWKVIKITASATARQLRVLARPAMDESPRGTDLHINREQAVYLFGGPPIPAKGEVIVRETSEMILDPVCSIEGRSQRFLRITKDLCAQGKSVELAYLLNTLGR